MGNEKEKKGLFERLTGSKKAKKGSCCGSFEIEELPAKKEDNTNGKTPKKDKKGNSCC